MVVQFKIYSALIPSKVSKSHFVVKTQSVLHKSIAFTYESKSNAPKGHGEHGSTPPTYLCIP